MQTTKDDKLVSGLIHALRTELTLYMFSDNDRDRSKIIDDISSMLTKLELIIKSDDFSRRQVDLAELIAGALKKLDKKNSERIEFDSCNLEVYGDRDSLKTMFAEMIQNALDFSDKKIYLSMHDSGAHAVIRIEDFGNGIPESIQARMAEPFVTGEESSGHGLGFAMIWSVIQAHDGAMTLFSEEGRGTTVLVSLDLV